MASLIVTLVTLKLTLVWKMFEMYWTVRLVTYRLEMYALLEKSVVLLIRSTVRFVINALETKRFVVITVRPLKIVVLVIFCTVMLVAKTLVT